MYELLSLPLDNQTLAEYSQIQELRQELHALGCDGIEAIWGGEEVPDELPEGLVIGYHLTFFPDWLDFWREDKHALLAKFGTLDAVRAFYGGWGGRASACAVSCRSCTRNRTGRKVCRIPRVRRVNRRGLHIPLAA